jgi:hypothetical protein
MALDESRDLFRDSANIFRVTNEDYKERLSRRIVFIKQMIVLRQFEASFSSTRWRSNVAIAVSVGSFVFTAVVALWEWAHDHQAERNREARQRRGYTSPGQTTVAMPDLPFRPNHNSN